MNWTAQVILTFSESHSWHWFYRMQCCQKIYVFVLFFVYFVQKPRVLLKQLSCNNLLPSMHVTILTVMTTPLMRILISVWWRRLRTTPHPPLWLPERKHTKRRQIVKEFVRYHGFQGDQTVGVEIWWKISITVIFNILAISQSFSLHYWAFI